jgi:hypothetical protein
VCIYFFIFFLPESEFKAGKSGITLWIYRYNILLPVHVKPTWARYTTLSTVGAAAVFVWFFLPFFRLLILVFSPLLCTYFTTSCCAQTGRVRGPAPSDAIIVLFRVLRFFHTVCIRLSLLFYSTLSIFLLKREKLTKNTNYSLLSLFSFLLPTFSMFIYYFQTRWPLKKKLAEGRGRWLSVMLIHLRQLTIPIVYSFFLRFFLLWT